MLPIERAIERLRPVVEKLEAFLKQVQSESLDDLFASQIGPPFEGDVAAACDYLSKLGFGGDADDLRAKAGVLWKKWTEAMTSVALARVPKADYRRFCREHSIVVRAGDPKIDVGRMRWLRHLANDAATLGRALLDGIAKQVESPPKVPDQFAAGDDGGSRKANANARMQNLIQRKSGAQYYTAKEWAEALGYSSPSTIKETPTWKTLGRLREARKAEAGLARAEREGGRGRRW